MVHNLGAGQFGAKVRWVYVKDDEFETKLLKNDWRAFLGTRQSFSEALLDAHEVDTANFYEKLTSNYARFSNIKILKRDEMISLLNDEMSLTGRTMAQVSNNWLALTNQTKEKRYA